MSSKKIPNRIRSLIHIKNEELEAPASNALVADRIAEAKRVVRRISKIVLEHCDASVPLGFKFGQEEIEIVITALKDHAKGIEDALDLTNYDEVQSHCINRLFGELVDEPSNILYVTPTGPNSTRYEAMDPSFWIECLDLLGERIKPNNIKHPFNQISKRNFRTDTIKQ